MVAKGNTVVDLALPRSLFRLEQERKYKCQEILKYFFKKQILIYKILSNFFLYFQLIPFFFILVIFRFQNGATA